MSKNEELIQIRDQEKKIYLHHQRRSKFLGLIYILGYIIGIVLFLVVASMYGDNKPRDNTYYIMFSISMTLIAIATIVLGIWIYHFVNIKTHKRKMDEASYELTHRVMNHIDD